MRPSLAALAPVLLLACGPSTGPGSTAPTGPSPKKLPAETSLLVSANLQSLHRTPTFEKGVELLLEMMKMEGDDPLPLLERLQDNCAFSPFRDIHQLTIAAGDEDEEVVFMLSGNFTRTQFNQCAAGFGLEQELMGEVARYDDFDLFAYWPNENTIALTEDAEENLPFLRAVADGTGTGLTPPMQEGLEQLRRGAPIRVVNLTHDRHTSLFHAMELDEVGESEVAPTLATASVNADDGVQLAVSIQWASPTAASSWVGQAQANVNEATNGTPLSFYMSALSMKAEGANALVELRLPQNQVDALMALGKTALQREHEEEERWKEEYAERRRREREEQEARKRNEERRAQEEADRQARLRQFEIAKAAAEERQRKAKEEAQRRMTQAKAHSDQGRAYLDAGVFDKAVEEFAAANRLMPHPDFLYNIAFSYDNQRNKAQEALDYYQRYLQAAPQGSMASVARRRVAKLTKKLRRSR